MHIEHGWKNNPSVRENVDWKEIRIIVRSIPLEAVKKYKARRWAIYCKISGNEPSSVTLYKTGSESQTFLLQFQEFKDSYSQRGQIIKILLRR